MSNVVRLIALKMKETGADVHAIGDGGFAGCTTACRCTLRRCASV